MKKKGLPPIADSNSRVLILGTFPGPLSLESSQYYAHQRNVFWRIMADLLGFELNTKYNDRVRILKNSEIAVWDVLASCEREGALDRNIQNPIANNFKSFLARHRRVEKVFFNGHAAESLYRRLVQSREMDGSIQYCYLPSTSPANARTLFEQKIAAWQTIVE